MTDRTSFYPELEKKIAPAQGKLAVLLPGLGAVSTTLIAGVHLIRKGLAKPFGSVTQMQKLRLGKRTQPRFKPVKELVPLTELSDLVFGGWDVYPDDAYVAAKRAGVLEAHLVEQLGDELRAIKPMPAVFEQEYVRNLHGDNVKPDGSKMEWAEALIADIQAFSEANGCDRLVAVWCGSTEIYNLLGSYVPFAVTKAEREAGKDPRPSIAERYRNREDYLAKLRAAAPEPGPQGKWKPAPAQRQRG